MIRLGEFLHGVAPSLNLEALLREASIWTRWDEIVGAQVAAMTQPRRRRRTTLYVDVRDSMWLQQLSYMQPLMLERIRALVGPGIVERLFFGLVADGEAALGSGDAPGGAPPRGGAGQGRDEGAGRSPSAGRRPTARRPAPAGGQPRARPPVSQAGRDEIEHLVRTVPQAALREALRRLFLSSVARGETP
ncbi:MAG: DUF721 domain-containing protein [Candidatus Tectomicrobia bacterium]|nr:DUF721 domain-containing protein [Candidatus Tectomicrobia bacterium]